MIWLETPIYIVNRDNLTRGFVLLLTWLHEAGHGNITVIDNASTYEPLLDFYEHIPAALIRTGRNLGPYAFWELGLHSAQSERFIVADPDTVPAPCCPSNLVQRLHQIMDKYQASKVGPSLRLDNLPNCYSQKQRVLDWEAQFWQKPTEAGDAYDAQIDTTFALYEPGSLAWPPGRYLRLAAPYLAEHLPWYEDSQRPTEECTYYRSHVESKWTNW